jgi:AcrR family transcriptional regulator
MATPAGRAPTLASDGRVRRGERSGHAIVEALLELIGDGIMEPTAQQVATRAGVGIRTVFRRFSDMESLYAEMGARVHAAAAPLVLDAQPSGDLMTRARELVSRRVVFFERIAPFKRSANLKRWRSPFLRDRHADLVRRLRADLLRWLPELDHAPDALVEALDLVTSFEAWDRLRTEQRLGRERAQAALERMVLGIVAELDRRPEPNRPPKG